MRKNEIERLTSVTDYNINVERYIFKAFFVNIASLSTRKNKD